MVKKYDVIIIGGGTSGCACAYMCSKNNLKTLLVEKNNYLGGLMTGGLVIPIMNSSVEDLNNEYYKKLIKKAKKFNAQITYDFNKTKNDGWLNPEILKIVIEDLLTEPKINKNLDILLETQLSSAEVENHKIKNIILKSGITNLKVGAKSYIDASGFGILAHSAGARFQKDTNLSQQNTLRFILGNVDIEKFAKFILATDKDRNITNTYRNDIDTNNELHFTTASTSNSNQIWALDKVLKEGVKNKLLKNSDREYFQIFSVASAQNQVAFNCPRIKNCKDNLFDASKELINAKKAIYRLYTFAKTSLPGFENSLIVNIATQTGIREEGRIEAKYNYNDKDMYYQKTFKTPVLKANYGIDIHSNKTKQGYIETPSYELPLESLMCADIDNLYAIGKLVGANFKAHSALRVQKSVMSMGEGLAKYLAKK